jgi:hypothetical protein
VDLNLAGKVSVVTVSSVNAFLPDPGIPGYCASKGALSNFCKSLSRVGCVTGGGSMGAGHRDWVTPVDGSSLYDKRHVSLKDLSANRY